MTDDERRADIERRAAERLVHEPHPGSKPEHFGFYAERVYGGFDTIGKLIDGTPGQFAAAAHMMAMYYAKFTADVCDVRFIERVCLMVMVKGADRPTGWDVAMRYHEAVRERFGPDYDLDNYTVLVMTENEATPEVVNAALALSNDNMTKH